MNSKWICLIAGLALAAGTLPAQDRWASGFGLDPSDAEAVREAARRYVRTDSCYELTVTPGPK